MSEAAVSLDTELRKLRPAEIYTLGQILNVSDSWKKLMAVIPKDGTTDFPKFNSEHFSMIEQAVKQQRRNAAEIFLEEWGTMGRTRPTLRTLLAFLVKAELFRAADYIAADLVKGELPKRPDNGPAATIDISEEAIRRLLEENTIDDNNDIESSLFLGSSTELTMEKQIFLPDRTLGAVDSSGPSSYLDQNMQSTELAEKVDYTYGKYCPTMEKNIARNANPENIPNQMSDFLKFSSLENNNVKEESEIGKNPSVTPNGITQKNSNNNEYKNLSPANVYEKQEMSSGELPMMLNEFRIRDSSEIANDNCELQSNDLPLFLNKSTFSMTTDSQTKDPLMDSADSNVPNLNVLRSEMLSTDLPQVIIDLQPNTSINNQGFDNARLHSDTNVKTSLSSQELPITVLEYQHE